MPRKPKRPCRMTGCPNLTDRKSCYCEMHEKTMQRHYDHFTRGYDQHERYGSAWRRIRDRHLAGHPLCEICKEQGRYILASLVHHIRPISDGGTNDERNLKKAYILADNRFALDAGWDEDMLRVEMEVKCRKTTSTWTQNCKSHVSPKQAMYGISASTVSSAEIPLCRGHTSDCSVVRRSISSARIPHT